MNPGGRAVRLETSTAGNGAPGTSAVSTGPVMSVFDAGPAVERATKLDSKATIPCAHEAPPPAAASEAREGFAPTCEKTAGVAFALALIRFYQRYISSLTPPSCRFYPTCSHYTYQCIERYGLTRGLWLGARRVCRCHPFCRGGYDPIPDITVPKP